MVALILSILSYIGKDVCNHLYGTLLKPRTQDVILQNAIVFTAALLVTVPLSLTVHLSLPLLLYGVAFGVCYVITNVALVVALCKGPAGPVTMISGAGIIGGIIYGVVACGEQMRTINGIGIAVLLATVMLLSPSEKKKRAYGNWYVTAILACVFHGVLTCIKKAYTHAYGSENITGFMCVGFAVASVLLWGICVYYKGKRQPFVSPKAKPLSFALCTVLPGVFVAFSTAAQMVAMTQLPTFVVYAFTPAGINVMMCFLSVFVFKELRFSLKISAALALFVVGTMILFV